MDSNHKEYLVHFALLQSEPSYLRPQNRCLTFGGDGSKEETLAEAEELVSRYAGLIAGMMFIERTGEPATVSLECDICEARRQRHGRHLLS